jgi:hypothetical protein
MAVAIEPATGPGAPGRARWRRLAACLAALALAWPGAAHPYTLPQLLALPFERLLQLTIQPMPAATLERRR